MPYWIEFPLPNLDYLLNTFPSDDSIREIVSWYESLWEDHNHKSYFLPNANSVEPDLVSLIAYDIVEHP